MALQHKEASPAAALVRMVVVVVRRVDHRVAQGFGIVVVGRMWLLLSK